MPQVQQKKTEPQAAPYKKEETDVFINWKRLLLAVYRLEEGQQEILAKLDRMEKEEVQPFVVGAHHDAPNREPDEWVQKGIDSILSYQVGKKKTEDEQ